jgi:hypothetical protein
MADPLVYTVAETVRIGGANKNIIYRLIREGVLDGRKAGRRTLITAESLRAYVAGLPKIELPKRAAH